MKGRGTDEQGNWILGFGPWLRVLKPRELQDEVGLLVQECAPLSSNLRNLRWQPHRVRKGDLKSCTTGHWTTIYLQNGGTLEYAQNIANHESPRTTKLYDLTREKLTFEEVERVKI